MFSVPFQWLWYYAKYVLFPFLNPYSGSTVQYINIFTVLNFLSLK